VHSRAYKERAFLYALLYTSEKKDGNNYGFILKLLILGTIE